jgi:fructose-specific phosphotransferase system IIA component
MRLSDILTDGRVKASLQATTKEGLIAEMVDLLVASGDVTDRDKALAAVLERERTRTTGIGTGLALPHGRCAFVRTMALAVGRTSRPVDFESIDGKPVSLVLLLLSPPDQTAPHIQALARISRLLSADAVRAKLLSADGAEQIYKLLIDHDAQAG